MRKALATIGTGPFRELLALSLPTFARYAKLHGYDVVTGIGDEADGRPASWGKIPLLQRLLESYDFVVWMDCDVLILDASVDLEAIIPADAFQAFAIATREPERGDCPLMGVWALRADARAQRFLAEVWKQEDLVSHRLWEQSAAMRLLGWTTELPFEKTRPERVGRRQLRPIGGMEHGPSPSDRLRTGEDPPLRRLDHSPPEVRHGYRPRRVARRSSALPVRTGRETLAAALPPADRRAPSPPAAS